MTQEGHFTSGQELAEGDCSTALMMHLVSIESAVYLDSARDKKPATEDFETKKKLEPSPLLQPDKALQKRTAKKHTRKQKR